MKDKIIILATVLLVPVVFVVAISFFLLLVFYPTSSKSVNFVVGKITGFVYGRVVNGISYFSSEPFAKFVVYLPVDDATSISIADFDGDGDPDILATANEENILAWWRNDGKKFLRSVTFTRFVIEKSPGIGDINVAVADIDGDGDEDILGVGPPAVAAGVHYGLIWWRNDGINSATKEVIFTKLLIDENGINSVYAVDFDKDGDQDILGAVKSGKDYGDSVAWWKNNGKGIFTRIIIGRENASIVRAADFDGDGAQDILSASLSTVAWWRNEGNGRKFTKHVIHSGYASDIHIADLDGDSSNDFLVADRTTDAIIWWKNDGQGNFAKFIVEEHFDSPTSVDTADFDRDGDLDIVGTNQNDWLQPIIWWRNDGEGSFTKLIIDKVLGGAYSAHAVDIDGDGDKDIVAGVAWTDTITWWKNNLEN